MNVSELLAMQPKYKSQLNIENFILGKEKKQKTWIREDTLDPIPQVFFLTSLYYTLEIYLMWHLKEMATLCRNRPDRSGGSSSSKEAMFWQNCPRWNNAPQASRDPRVEHSHGPSSRKSGPVSVRSYLKFALLCSSPAWSEGLSWQLWSAQSIVQSVVLSIMHGHFGGAFLSPEQQKECECAAYAELKYWQHSKKSSVNSTQQYTYVSSRDVISKGWFNWTFYGVTKENTVKNASVNRRFSGSKSI